MSLLPPKIEPFYVVDTNALIWHLLNDRKLGKAAAQVFVAAERGETLLLVSAVVMAELYYANQKFGLFGNFADVFASLEMAPHFRLVAFYPAHVLEFDGNVAVAEMHDRIITGLARRLGAPLLTSDPQIADSNLATVVW